MIADNRPSPRPRKVMAPMERLRARESVGRVAVLIFYDTNSNDCLHQVIGSDIAACFVASIRVVLRFCLGACTGNRFSRPHVLHLMTRTSAQGFFPFLLLFSTVLEHVFPSTRIVLQNLQMVRFMSGLIRIIVLRVTSRRSVTSRRDTPWTSTASLLCPPDACSEDAGIITGGSSALRGAGASCCAVARYVAAW